MQLIDFLKTADKDEYIYLGAASCFLWIAKPDEMIERLPKLDDDHTEKLRCSVKYNDTLIKYYERCLKTAQSEFEEKELKCNLEKVQRKRKESAERIENRIPFAARLVKDVYRRKMVEPFGLCVIIEGHEIGDYWTLEELEDDDGQ